MVLEWREREHEIMDHATLQSAPTIQELRTSGLLTVSEVLSMIGARELPPS